SYGALGLELMRVGKSAAETLRGLLAADDHRELRQVAMVDARGGVAAHTGALAIKPAGHIVGEQLSVQANMMLRDTVWPAMARVFADTRGELVDRMLAALDAAEAEGGDIRGMQSSALLVVGAHSTGRPWADRIFDLRVDDHRDPLLELRRLVAVRRAYLHMSAADRAFARGDVAQGNLDYEAAERLIGDNPEMRYWHAIALASVGQLDAATPILRELFARDPNWRTLTTRLPRGMFPRLDDAALARICAIES
ncbi:MAG TPA: DUF1028 domain-containing protein, partial [Candidatus Binataceae bacterium]|nr:DUF1028 domain-containing protein [Candidatus Binataceae bacterium]